MAQEHGTHFVLAAPQMPSVRVAPGIRIDRTFGKDRREFHERHVTCQQTDQLTPQRSIKGVAGETGCFT